MAQSKKAALAAKEKRAAAVTKAKALRENTLVGKQLGGFMDFVREQGVVGLAVGLALGTAATVLVKSIVDNIVMPLVGWLLPGSGNIVTKTACLDSVDGVCTNVMAWGVVVSNLISFLAVALVIYFVVKGLKLDKLDKKKA